MTMSNTASTYSYAQEATPYTGTFDDTTMFFDDHFYPITPTPGAASVQTFGATNSYIANNDLVGCELTDCTIMQYDRSTFTCDANYTDNAYISMGTCPASTCTTTTGYASADTYSAGYWMLKNDKSTYYDLFRTGVLTVNLYPPMQFKIWVCMQCSNEFQTVTTKPFMVAVQCNPSSTTITVVDDEMKSAYAYHRRVQTFEANDEARSIYFEFDDFSSSSLACPIIQYRITA